MSLSPFKRQQFFNVCLVTLTLLFSMLLCGCRETSKSPRDAAEELARMFSEKRLSEAYEGTAPAFRFRRSQKYFEARVRDLGLGDALSVKWEDAERNGKLATVRGVFTFKDDGVLPLKFVFGIENGGWRLLEARSAPAPGTGIAEDIFAVEARTSDTVSTRALEILEPNDTEIPPESQLRQLAEDTLLLFNEAIQNGGDFSGLYAAASDRWKYRGRDPKMDPYNNDGRVTIAAFRKAFAAAIEAKVDISPIREKKMILSEPARVNSDGVLILNGTFDAAVFQASLPGSPRRAMFMLEYVREAARWKLFGLTVNIVAPESKAGITR